MNSPQPTPSPEGRWSETDSRNSMLIEADDRGTVSQPPRPITPEEIAAIKRFWERQGRKPPPPWDKL
jgi:hypothetical protein